ncbi:cell surface protein [Borreliella lusitaniae]|uniref:cell surface protein n=1 Tax=Borreliella lusitaniae TaxID=100177 RepID=UPI0026472181|nr:cell surface protein [Borreliella lusitaniae]WKC84900.1 cell surface protein [Borreliella lusitaniae]
MKQYLLGCVLVLALMACAQKGAEPTATNDLPVDAINSDKSIDYKKEESKEAPGEVFPLKEENTVSLFNKTKIFVSKEKNKDGKYDLRATINGLEFKGTSDKNDGSGTIEAVKADKTKISILIAEDLNSLTVITYDKDNKQVTRQVVGKQESTTEETYDKNNKLTSRKITRSNDTTIEYSKMTDADNASQAVETLKNGIKLEGTLVGGKTELKLKEGSVTLTKEIDKDGKIKLFLQDTVTDNNKKKTATWKDSSNTLTITVNSKKTKDLVFLADGKITEQKYDLEGSKLVGSPSEIKCIQDLKNALR